MSPWAAAARYYPLHYPHAHKYIFNYYKTIPYFPMISFFFRVSCENFCTRWGKKQLHTFLSEDDLVVSLLAVIRSGYPVFFSKQRPRSFTYSVCYCLISEKKKNSREIFFLTLTIRRRFVTLGCLLTRLVE